jgi:hypothetical protein
MPQTQIFIKCARDVSQKKPKNVRSLFGSGSWNFA